MLAYLLLGAAQALGLLLTPFGWPGVWIQLAAVCIYAWRSGFESFGVVPLGLLVTIALVVELLGALLAGGRLDPVARRRAGFAGLAGAAGGGALGFWWPLFGPIFGSVAGALLGTLLSGLRLRRERIGRATLLGQMIAIGFRAAAGVVVAVFILLTLVS